MAYTKLEIQSDSVLVLGSADVFYFLLEWQPRMLKPCKA